MYVLVRVLIVGKKFNTYAKKLLCENRIIYHAYPPAN